MDMTTSAHGCRIATSVGAAVLGRGADLIIIDDPMKADDALSEKLRRRANEFYDNTLYSRLNNKVEGAIIIVMQRLHEADLVGHVLGKGEAWEVVKLPAIAAEDATYDLGSRRGVHRRRAGELLHPVRESQAVLDEVRRNLGSLSFSAQYQQEPLSAEGNTIKRSWIRYYEEAPSDFDLVIASWDTAYTLEESSDYSVGTVWGVVGAEFYLLDVVRGRLETPDLRRVIIDTHRQHDADATLIEGTELGRAIAQEMRRVGPILPITPRAKFDKTARLLAQTPKFEAGQVLLPREAPWLRTFP
jgi:predicted phage terminase large subunit-like protein